MLNRLGDMFGVPVYETAVGFKYIAPIMLAQKAVIGGEESGGYGFQGHVLERDGILASLYFLDLMVKTGKIPSQLLDYLYSKVGPHHYERVDVEFPTEQREAITNRVKQSKPKAIDGVKVTKIDTTDGFRFVLDDGSWLLIRFSGTEPLLRIYSETDSTTRARRLLQIGQELAGIQPVSA
jgi:phosphomannomutase